jgi:hypothetical protein
VAESAFEKPSEDSVPFERVGGTWTANSGVGFDTGVAANHVEGFARRTTRIHLQPGDTSGPEMQLPCCHAAAMLLPCRRRRLNAGVMDRYEVKDSPLVSVEVAGRTAV